MNYKIKKLISLLILGMITGGFFSFVMKAEFIAASFLLFSLAMIHADFSIYNLYFYLKALTFLLGAFLGRYMIPIIQQCQYTNLMQKVISFVPFVIFVIFIILVIFAIFLCWRNSSTNYRNNEWEDLNKFGEREKDLERLEKLMQDSYIPTIGVESKWGEGKTFLINWALDDLKFNKNMELDAVRIDVLAVRLDNFPEYLIRELSSVLQKHHRFSNYSKKLQETFHSIKLDIISSIWDDRAENYTDLFDDFREEILRIGHPVFLIYEDIDRLNNADQIRDILYISEKLTMKNNLVNNGRIQVIYQYDQKNLQKLGFDFSYLEKYIYSHINISDIEFHDKIRNLQEDIFKKKEIEKARLTYNEISDLLPNRIVHDETFDTAYQWAIEYLSPVLTVRRTKEFLIACANEFRWIKGLTSEDRRIIIGFSYIQYFLPLAYQKIKQNIDVGLSYAFNIDGDGELQNIIYLMQSTDRKNSEFKNKNKNMIDYHTHPEAFELYLACKCIKLNVSDIEVLHKGEVNFPLCSLNEYISSEDRYKKERISYYNLESMIKYLLCAGKPAFNHYVEIVYDLEKAVLSFDRKDWIGKFNRFIQGKFGDGTIISISWKHIFLSYCMTRRRWGDEEASDHFEKLIDLYSEYRSSLKEENQFFSQDFIDETINIWDGLRHGKELAYFAEYVAMQRIKYNWSKYKKYNKYIDLCINAIMNAGYISIEQDLSEYKITETKDTKSKLEAIKKGLNDNRVILAGHLKFLLNGNEEKNRLCCMIDMIDKLIEVCESESDGSVKIDKSEDINFDNYHIKSREKPILVNEPDEEKFIELINDPERKLTVAEKSQLIKERDNLVSHKVVERS